MRENSCRESPHLETSGRVVARKTTSLFIFLVRDLRFKEIQEFIVSE
jgi:hypothetical protein